jgi:hypothetical protein
MSTNKFIFVMEVYSIFLVVRYKFLNITDKGFDFKGLILTTLVSMEENHITETSKKYKTKNCLTPERTAIRITSHNVHPNSLRI